MNQSSLQIGFYACVRPVYSGLQALVTTANKRVNHLGSHRRKVIQESSLSLVNFRAEFDKYRNIAATEYIIRSPRLVRYSVTTSCCDFTAARIEATTTTDVQASVRPGRGIDQQCADEEATTTVTLMS